MIRTSALVLSCIAGFAAAASAQTAHPMAGAVGPQVSPPLTDADALWDQSAFDSGLAAYVDTQFEDFPTYSTYMVDDFNTGADAWNVESITTYFTMASGFWDPAQIITGSVQVFPKAGTLPDNGTDNVPEYPVGIRVTDGGGFWIVTADTTGIAELQSLSGEYWIGLTPDVNFGAFGQEFHLQLPSFYRDEAAARNPGGAFGVGTDWVGVSAFGSASDMAFKLEGSIAGGGCYPDCNNDGVLDLFDFLCFTNDFNTGGAYSDCVSDGSHDLFDFLCFLNAFNAGC